VTLSRREALAWLAGLGATACTGRIGDRTIEGSIVGGNVGRGHRILDGFRPRPRRFDDVPVVILGGGVAGLSAAWTFKRAGFHDFVILELEDTPGGTARSGQGPITPYPWGAHYVVVPPPSNRPLAALLEEVGAVEGRDPWGRPVWAESVLCREPQERLYFRGSWYEGLYPRAGASASDIRQLEAFEADMRRWAQWRDRKGRRGFALPRSTGSDAEEIRALDREAMAEYMDGRGWTSPRLRWFVEYGCRDDFGTSLGRTSAWAGIHYFASRLEEGDREPAEFLTWPEGNGRLVAHLAAMAGPRLRLGCLVTEVDPRPDSVGVAYVDAAGNALGLRAEQVVFALPRFLAAPLLTTWRDRPPAFLAATRYGTWVVANLTLRDRPPSHGFPLAWDNVLYDSPALGYVVATHQTGRDYGPTVLTWYEAVIDDDPKAARARVMATSWQDWVDRILADLGPAHLRFRDLVDRIDVYLWGHAMVQPLPGFAWSEALAASSRPLGRVHFAHTDLSAIALFEEAQYWGIRAAEEILVARRHAFRPWLS
jgi:glycine/D-amino acid oxidase-like deaminating enzyme